jgi:drug/metabolite transporter (DMT)-like permease
MSLATHRLRLLAAALLFSTGGAAIKSTTLGAWQVASFRSGVAALAVLLLVPAARRGWNWKVVLVGISYAATMIAFVTANKLTTAANTIFLQSTAPLYILLLGPWLLRERVKREEVFFMIPVAVGMFLFFVGESAPAATAPDPALGNIIAAFSGVLWATTLMGLRWLGRQPGQENAAISTVGVGNLITFLVCLPMALPVHGATTVDWVVIGYLGVFQIGLAYLLLSTGIRHLPALEASVLLLAEPALNPVWAWLVHGETPGPWAIAGGVLILGASSLKTWYEGRAVRVLPVQ